MMYLCKLVLIIPAFVVFPTYGQTLVSFKVSVTGAVIPILYPKPLINPIEPTFQYPFKPSKEYCNDTVIIQSTYSNNIGANTTTKTKTFVCKDEIEVLNKHFFKNDGWVASPDLAVIAGLDQNGDDLGTWTKIDEKTWQFRSSQASYSSYITGPRIIQVWKLDRKKRVKEVIQTNDQGEVTLTLKISYSKCNLVSGITKTFKNAQVHHLWFYDKKRRAKMMIIYFGNYMKLSVRQRESLQQRLASYIRSGKEPPDSFLDSMNIGDIVTYHYGHFGIENINFCRKEASDLHGFYSSPRKYVSDSIFYNSKGQIVRYTCPKTWGGYVSKIVFTYDTLSNRLTSYFGTSIWADEWCNETAALLLLDYNSSGIIKHSKQKLFENTYRQKNPQSITPDDNPKSELEKWYYWQQ